MLVPGLTLGAMLSSVLPKFPPVLAILLLSIQSSCPKSDSGMDSEPIIPTLRGEPSVPPVSFRRGSAARFGLIAVRSHTGDSERRMGMVSCPVRQGLHGYGSGSSRGLLELL